MEHADPNPDHHDFAAERAELVDWLLTQGFTAEQIDESFAPMLLPARRALGDDGVLLSARQISARTGLDLPVLQRVLAAAGRPHADNPDAQAYMSADERLAGYTRRCLELGVGEEPLLSAVQVLTDGMSKSVEAMRYAALSSILKPGASELESAKASAALTAAFAPLLGPMVQDIARVELLHILETEAVSTSERAAGLPLPGARLVSVAFADLVGFTRLGEEVAPEDLEHLSHRLTELAREVAQPPVRYIKTIGDEVMLVSADPEPLLSAVLDLVDAAGADPQLPQLKAGMATGMAVSRAGDWFGSPVNQASRVTGVTRAGAVLLAESAREAIGAAPGYDFSFAGARRLKGIRDEVKVYRARRSRK